MVDDSAGSERPTGGDGGQETPPPEPPGPRLPPRRSLPRAARLSRLQPGAAPANKPAPAPAAPLPQPVQPPLPPDDPVLPPSPPARTPPLPTVSDLAAQVAQSQPAPDPTPSGGPTGGPTGGNVGTPLRALPGGLINDPTGRTDSFGGGAPVFRPLVDRGAQRAALMSGIGLVSCLAPILSVLGIVLGYLSLRRIQRSDGRIIGEKTARFGIYLGIAGVILGATVDMVLIIRS